MTRVPQQAVIIPHYNDPDRLRRCLGALVGQAYDAVEIVVVDNSSPVDLGWIRDDFPQVRVVTETEKGAGPARNRGVAETTAPWVLFLDADCVPAPDWLAVGAGIARDRTVIGGRVDVFHETPPPLSGAEAFEQVFAFKMRAYLERDGFLGAGNLVTSRAVFGVVGGFRPAVSEDKDWSQRAARAGFTLTYDDDFIASHPSRQDWPALRHKWRRLTREAFLLGHLKPLSRVKWGMRALLMPLSIVVHSPRILRNRTLTIGEKWRAFGILAKLRLCRMVWMLGQAVTGRP